MPLVNADSFNAIFTDMHFQKVPIPHLMYYETEIPSLKRISLHIVLTTLFTTNFAHHNFSAEQKVALTNELVYKRDHSKISN